MANFLKHLLIIFLLFGFQSVFALQDAVGEHGINAYALHKQGITGQGVNIGFLSAGNARKGHVAFERGDKSAVMLYDFTGSGLSRSAHDTEMAGIILSAGSFSHPDQMGLTYSTMPLSQHGDVDRIHLRQID